MSPAYVEKMNHGAAIKDGKLVFGTHDGFLIALDAGTGREVWVRDAANPKENQGGFTLSPIIAGDLVIAAPAGQRDRRQGLGRRVQARDRRAGLAVQHHSQTTANPAPRPGPTRIRVGMAAARSGVR